MPIPLHQLPILHRDLYEENLWSKQYIERLIEEPSYPEDYPNVIEDLNNCLDRIDSLCSKKILVVGSVTPWIECLLLNRGSREVYFTDVSYITIEDDRIKFIKIDDLEKYKFDLIISFSSVEHFGLGRYGDELNENGDIEFMNQIASHLNNEGVFILGVPVAEKYLLCHPWHRIYDIQRISLLTEKYNIEFSSKNNKISNYIDFEMDPLFKLDWQNQPCIFLRKKSS
jgi:SAM-dependent methyltransferase